MQAETSTECDSRDSVHTFMCNSVAKRVQDATFVAVARAVLVHNNIRAAWLRGGSVVRLGHIGGVIGTRVEPPAWVACAFRGAFTFQPSWV